MFYSIGLGCCFYKSPGQFISCFFRVTNLSAILLLYCDAFFASPWQGNQLVFLFFCFCFPPPLFQCWAFWEWCPFPCYLIHLGFFPAWYFIQHKYLLVPTVMAGQNLLCHLYKALLYVHDIELVEIVVWWTMSVCVFPPHQNKVQGNKNGKTKKKIVLF